MNRQLVHLLFPILSGILVSLAFPRVGWSVAAWVALWPLLIAVAESRGPAEAAVDGLVFGLVEQLCLLTWIPGVLQRYGSLGPLPAWALFLLMIVALAAFPAAALAGLRFCGARKGSTWLLLAPFFWVTQEYALAHFPFGGFPWLLMGYTQGNAPAIAQIADTVGVSGVSWLLVAFAAAAVYKIRSPGRPFSATPLVVGTLLIALSFAYGTVALRRWSATEPQHTVAAIQQDITVDEDAGLRAWKFGESYVERAQPLVGRAELLLLPEAPAALIWENDAPYRAAMSALARQFPMGLVLSNIAFERVGDEVRYFNSAYVVNSAGRESGRYDKVHLVPFGEYLPLRRFLPFIELISKDVGSFSPGTDVVNLALNGHSAGVIVCFEAAFPQLCRRFVQEGAQILINLTNDTWYGDTSAPYQHLAIARWRAIENRRYLLRAANSGISAVIDPAGRLIARTRLLSQDVLLGRFGFESETSFYSRHGDILAPACAIISGLTTVLAAFVRRRRREV